MTSRGVGRIEGESLRDSPRVSERRGYVGAINWRDLVRRHTAALALVVGLTFTGVSVGVLKPWPLKLVVDNVLTGEPLPESVGWLRGLPGGESASGLLFWLAAASVLIFAIHWLMQAWQSYVQSGLGSRMSYAVGEELFDHLQRLSPRFHARHGAGDLLRRVTTDAPT